MKVTMVMVMSLDGRVTRGDNPDIYTWTSPEDQKQFFRLISKSKLIVMGRKTYESAKEYIKLTPNTLRVVLTRQPKKYRNESVPGQLEFSNESPSEFVTRMQISGYQEFLLVGGSTINALFLSENLVNELILTIEPKIFGNGTLFITSLLHEIHVTLVKQKKLNNKGTLFLHYKILPKKT